VHAIAIIFLSIFASVIYGILHDQVTARICVEYFTVGHPPVFNTVDPTLLALGWGVIATWWVGLILGIPLALVARVGSHRKYAARELARPLAITLIVVGFIAMLAGVVGHFAATRGFVRLYGPLAEELPLETHIPFITDIWIHLASYIEGFIGGVVLCVRVVIWRSRAAAIHKL